MSLMQGYGIFNGKTAFDYLKELNPVPKKTRKISKTHSVDSAHFSFWAYSHYWECPLRYRWIIVDKKLPPFPDNKRNALEGGAMHLAIEKLLQLDPRPKDVLVWARDNAKRYFDEYLADIWQGFQWKNDKDPDKAYEYYLRILARTVLFVRDKVFNDPTIVKVHSELPFCAKIFPNQTVGGPIDCLLEKEVGGDRFAEVIDWKGTRTAYSVHREQLAIYGLGVMGALHLPVRRLSFCFSNVNKQIYEEFNDEFYEEVIYRLRVMGNRVMSNEFKATQNSNNCKYCQFNRACDEKPEDASFK